MCMQQKANTPKDNQKTMPQSVKGLSAPLLVINIKQNETIIRTIKGIGLIIIIQSNKFLIVCFCGLPSMKSAIKFLA